MPRKPKTPQDKKRESYAKDRRNTYGENAKASRKNIPRRKAIASRAARRLARQALAETASRGDATIADAAEARLIRKRRLAWVKQPDQPLGAVLMRKRQRRLALAGRKRKHPEAAG